MTKYSTKKTTLVTEQQYEHIKGGLNKPLPGGV